MSSPDRRQFLQFTAAFMGATPLVGCGNGGAEPDAPLASPPTTPPPPTGAPPPAVAPPPPASPTPPAPTGFGASSGAMQFKLLSAVTQAEAAFSLGFAFKRGDVPVGRIVGGDIVNLQATVKNRWPDGSVKYAVLAGRANLAANTPLVVRLSSITPRVADVTLTLADLKAIGMSAAIAAGAFGTASWSGADWEAPFVPWISGSQMSSWIYRKAVGSEAHLVAWLEVQLWASGAVEVLPWVENGYLLVASPGPKSATFSFSLGGTTRFSSAFELPHHCRAPLVSGTALSHWLGTDPAVSIHHDTAYLQATELVPSYSAVVSSIAGAVAGQVSTFTPLQQGAYRYAFSGIGPDGRDDMSTGGYGRPIGLLPEHDVLYLTANSGVEFGSVVRNAYSAGRYAIHYRDESTNRPIKFSSYPNLCLSQTNSRVKDAGPSTTSQYCPTPTLAAYSPLWDTAHCPSVGFMAYLLTGRHYFMEEVQFAATLHYLWNSDTPARRNGSQGLMHPQAGSLQTRAAAWAVRTLAQAVCVSPDAETDVRPELIASLEANANYYHATYVAQANNTFGHILADVDYNTSPSYYVAAGWMQDFSIGAWGYARAMDLPIGATPKTKLGAFFDWHAQFVVGRLGASSSPDWWYINGAVYRMTVSTSKSPDWLTGTGPWLASWRAMYDATSASAGVSTFGTTEGTLAAEFLPGADALWGNLQPAIAYAVRHGVPGAQAAYNRMRGASNFADLRNQFNTSPVWAVMPALI